MNGTNLFGGRSTGPLVIAAVVVVTAVAAVIAAIVWHNADDEAAKTAPQPCAAAIEVAGMPVDRCNPDAVMVTGAQIVFSYRPAQQDTQAESFADAGELISPDYRERVGVSASVLAPITGATWTRWADSSTVVTAQVRIEPADHPADTDNRRLRVLAITQHIKAPLGAAEPDQKLTAYMGVTRDHAGQPWQISLISLR